MKVPDFDVAPLLLIWETTRSCALACRHCRASAELGRRPDELTTEEGGALIDAVAGMGTPIMILSGGDPLNRPDLEILLARGKSRGLRMGTIPAATPGLTRKRLEGLRDLGLDQLAFSLDGPNAEIHDGLRGVPGAFERTIEAAGWARELGLPLQINTCFSQANVHTLEPMIELVSRLGVVFWEIFFLIPIGRGQSLGGLTPEEFEDFFEKLARLEGKAPFVVKLTEAQHYRRYAAKRREAKVSASGRGIGGGRSATPVAVNAGKGFVFVDYRGDICPSGFLPLTAGNVRKDSLAQVYRESPLFKELRDFSLLKGKCGLCEFKAVCSGSRARAHAVSGDYLAEDPGCAYVPAPAKSGGLSLKCAPSERASASTLDKSTPG